MKVELIFTATAARNIRSRLSFALTPKPKRSHRNKSENRAPRSSFTSLNDTRMNATKILSIDPGTRQLGVAVLDGNDLLYYGVKTLAKRSTAVDIRAEAARIVRALIAEYQPDVVAIEQQVTRQNAMMLNAVAREIKKTVKGIGLAVYEYAPKTVRQFICSKDGKATKRRTAQHELAPLWWTRSLCRLPQ